jgi:hypothetical protein
MEDFRENYISCGAIALCRRCHIGFDDHLEEHAKMCKGEIKPINPYMSTLIVNAGYGGNI